MSNSLPPAARRLIASVAISSFGTGLTIPFTLILLHEVRDIALPTVGLLLAVPGVVGLASVPVAGALIDRWGPRTVLRLALAMATLANVGLAYATSPATALPALVLLGLGLGPSFPAVSALMSGLVEGQAMVQRAFGMQFTALNATIGIGGLVGALVVDVDNAFTFEMLYVANAVTFVVQGLLLPAGHRPVRDAQEDANQPSYREVLADPVFRRVCLVSLLFALTGYAALDAGLPAFARVEGNVSPSAIAMVFAVNTAVIVGGQLLVLRFLRGRRRSTSLAIAAGLWALSWAILGLVPGLGQEQRIVAVLVFGGVFGLGECFMAPTLQPLVNALASDRLRGRYNAMSGAAFSIAFVVSPAISATLIAHGHGRLWLAGIVAGCLVSAVVAMRLARRLTDEQDGRAVQVLEAVTA